MLKSLIREGLYSIHEGFESWEDAFRAAVVPLTQRNYVTMAYADSIIKAVKEMGPYVIIVPGICLPHAEDKENVLQSGVCLMKTAKPVVFSDNPDEYASVFFVIACKDSETHQENMVRLSELLADEELMATLQQVSTESELLELAAKI